MGVLETSAMVFSSAYLLVDDGYLEAKKKWSWMFVCDPAVMEGNIHGGTHPTLSPAVDRAAYEKD